MRVEDVRLLQSRAFKFELLTLRELRSINDFDVFCRKICAKNCMVYVPVAGDGSCQFGSFLVGLNDLNLNREKLDVGGLRCRLRNFVLEECDGSEDVLRDFSLVYDESLADWAIRMGDVSGSSSSWGDELSLVLLCRIFGVRAMVCSMGKRLINGEQVVTNEVQFVYGDSGEDSSKPLIYLLFSRVGNHYNGMVQRVMSGDEINSRVARRLAYRSQCCSFGLKKLLSRGCKIFPNDTSGMNESRVIEAINRRNCCSVECSGYSGESGDAFFRAVLESGRSQGDDMLSCKSVDDLREACVNQYLSNSHLYVDELNNLLRGGSVSVEDYLNSLKAGRPGDSLIFRLVADCMNVCVEIVTVWTYVEGVGGSVCLSEFARSRVDRFNEGVGKCHVFIARLVLRECSKFYHVVVDVDKFGDSGAEEVSSGSDSGFDSNVVVGAGNCLNGVTVKLHDLVKDFQLFCSSKNFSVVNGWNVEIGDLLDGRNWELRMITVFERVNECRVFDEFHNPKSDLTMNSDSQIFAVLESLRLQGYNVNGDLDAVKVRAAMCFLLNERGEVYEDLLGSSLVRLGIDEVDYKHRLLRHLPGDDLTLRLLSDCLGINIRVAIFDYNVEASIVSEDELRRYCPITVGSVGETYCLKAFIYQVGLDYARIHCPVQFISEHGDVRGALMNALSVRNKLNFPCVSDVGLRLNSYGQHFLGNRLFRQWVSDSGALICSTVAEVPVCVVSNCRSCRLVGSEGGRRLEVPVLRGGRLLGERVGSSGVGVDGSRVLRSGKRVVTSSSGEDSGESVVKKRRVRNMEYHRRSGARRVMIRNICDDGLADWPAKIETERVNLCLDNYFKSLGDESLVVNVCCLCGVRVFERERINIVCFSDFKKYFWVPYHRSTDRCSLKDKSAFKKEGGVGLSVSDFKVEDFYLEPAGLKWSMSVGDNGVVCVSDVSFCMCCRCFPLGKTEVPKRAIVNCNEFGRVPDQLLGLTVCEEMLISRIRPVMCIYTLKDGGGQAGYKCLKGQCIAFPQDRAELENILPQSVDSLSDVLHVSFVGTRVPDDTDLIKKTLRVRRGVVTDALKYLISRWGGDDSPGVEVDESRLAQLPEDDVPEGVLDRMVLISDPHLINMERECHEGYYVYGSVLDECVPSAAQGDVVQIQNNFHLDSDGVGLTPGQRMNCALVNLALSGAGGSNGGDKSGGKYQSESVLVVTRGGVPVVEYDNASLWYDAFPTLFPDRKGAPEGCTDRIKRISLGEWVRHVLCLHDDRFRKHLRFVFYTANMMKRREVCTQARLKLNATGFSDVVGVLEKLTVEELLAAVTRVENKEPVADENISRLVENLKSVGSRVKGSTFAKCASRREIMSMQLYYGLPKFFVTVNPHDYDSPVLMFLSGEKLNISDPFDEALGFMRRKEIVTKDPVAAAMFFDMTIRKFVDILLGVGEADGGVLGQVHAYYGTVETQGRGTLHYHSLVWLSGFPNSNEFMRRIESVEYKARVKDYIDQTISACVRGRGDIPPVDISRIVKPSDEEFSDEYFADAVDFIANKTNMHRHSKTCFKNMSKPVCRFEFGDTGKALVEQTEIGEDGSVRLMRNNGWVNQFNKAVLYAIRSNIDFTFIPSSKSCRALAMYITDYITKNALSTHNLLSIVAAVLKNVVFSVNGKIVDVDAAKRVVVKCVNKINVLHEHSSAEVAHYLLGFGDHYTSSEFANLYVGNCLYVMKRAMVENCRNVCSEDDLVQGESVLDDEAADEFRVVVVDNHVSVVNQQLDYIWRGEELDDVCLYEFVSKYAKRRISKKPRGISHCKFMSLHPEAKTHHLVRVNSPFVPSLLKIPPRPKLGDDVSVEEQLYEQMVLLLFVPYRDVKELTFGKCSWRDALSCAKDAGKIAERMFFHMSCLDEVHGCMEQRDIDRENADADDEEAGADGSRRREFMELCEEELDDETLNELQLIAEKMMERELGKVGSMDSSEVAWRALRNCLEAVDSATVVGVGVGCLGVYTSLGEIVGGAVGDSFVDYLKSEVKSQNNAMRDRLVARAPEEPVVIEDVNGDAMDAVGSPPEPFEEAPRVVTINNDYYFGIMNGVSLGRNLNRKQKIAFEIVAKHLIKSITVGGQEPLRFVLTGEGGTGKSTVIFAIREFFGILDKSHLLRVTGSTGKAASLLDGATIHKLICFNPLNKKDGLTKSDALLANWNGVEYLIIDEISMIAADVFSFISKSISLAKSNVSGESFGGVSVIVVGDFYQLPPVKGSCLVRSLVCDVGDKDAKKDGGNVFGSRCNLQRSFHVDSTVGLEIFENEFTTVINLDEQMRQTGDPAYHRLLQRLRVGAGSPEDYEFLQSRVLGVEGLNFAEDIWRSRIIVMTNAVKDKLNRELVSCFARCNGREEVVVVAQDDYGENLRGDKHSSLRESVLNETSGDCGNLCGRLRLCVGMPVVVSSNISVALGVTNGTPGIVREIIFDRVDEHEAVSGHSVFEPTKMPLVVVVEIPGNKFSLPGRFPENCFPIVPITTKFRKTFGSKRTGKGIMISRRQFPLCENFACTNYKCQGDTYESVFVDLQSGPGTQTSAGAYVALSRVKTGRRLYILRDFEERVIRRGVLDGHVKGLKRLERCEEKTLVNIGL